jgi:Spy/CpxP family protein refolding chaperone
MQTQTWQTGLKIVSVMLFTCLAGCTISIQPWSKQTAPPVVAGPVVEAPRASPYPPGILPSSVVQPPAMPVMPVANNDQTVMLIKQLNETEDNRRALQDMVQTLRKQLKDREDKLRQASYDIEESSKLIKGAHQDLSQWHGEFEEMRERIRKLEKERADLQPLMKDIRYLLERDRDSKKWSAPKLTVPTLK